MEVIKSPSVSLETNAANTPAMIRMVGDDRFHACDHAHASWIMMNSDVNQGEQLLNITLAFEPVPYTLEKDSRPNEARIV